MGVEVRNLGTEKLGYLESLGSAAPNSPLIRQVTLGRVLSAPWRLVPSWG